MKRLAGRPQCIAQRGEVTWARQRNKYHYWPLRPKISLKQNILPQQRKFQQPASHKCGTIEENISNNI